MANKDFDPRNFIFTPADASRVTLEQAKDMKENRYRAMPLGLSGAVNQYFRPALPGQITSIIGQSHMNKSGTMAAIIRGQAEYLQMAGRGDEVIVWVSVEDAIEEAMYSELARMTGEDAGAIASGDIQDWDRLEAEAQKIAEIPIYRIGDSLVQPDMEGELYLSNMIRCIKFLKDDLLANPVKIAALHFDYLQAFPVDPEVKSGAQMHEARRLQVREDIYRLRKAAKYFDCPVFVNVQAKQTLSNDNRDFYMPGIYDGEESAAIGQRSDRIITLWMPKVSHGIGKKMKVDQTEYTAFENLLWIKVAKQRGRLPSGQAWPYLIDYATGDLKPSTIDLLAQNSRTGRIVMDWVHE